MKRQARFAAAIQALERNTADLPLQAGRVCKQEYEYTRHGTLCLIANWDVSEGKVITNHWRDA